MSSHALHQPTDLNVGQEQFPEAQGGFRANEQACAHTPASTAVTNSSVTLEALKILAFFVMVDGEGDWTLRMGYRKSCWTKGSRATARMVIIAPRVTNDQPLRLKSIVNAPENPRLASSYACRCSSGRFLFCIQHHLSWLILEAMANTSPDFVAVARIDTMAFRVRPYFNCGDADESYALSTAPIAIKQQALIPMARIS